jgi:hypothetical protein
MMGTATYMYAMTRPVPADRWEGLLGVTGSPVRVLETTDVACAVSTVELAEFGEDALRANLEDLEWLSRTAREHDDVVQAIARVVTSVPLRLATLCSDDASACDRLRDIGERVLTLLSSLDDRDEWGLKIFAPAPGHPPSVRASSGTGYLQQLRTARTRREADAAIVAREAEIAFRRLVALCADARTHRPQDQRLSGVPKPMLLNASFLVDQRETDDFRTAVAAVAARCSPGEVVLTGPWPPYSFGTLDPR